jgi:serine/threonine-protein kinase
MPIYELIRAYPLTSLVVLSSALAALFGLVLPARQRAYHERERLERLASMVVSREDDPWVGKQLGAYFLVERLGRGGMATVYLGVPTRSADRSQARAIKVIDREALGHSQELRFRFLREVKILARLRHPAIVLLEAYGEHDGLLYVAMEWIKGPTLASVIKPGGLPAEQAMNYLRPLFEAVGYAHSQGIVHRDLKPDNVLLAEGKQVKVVDFGLARAQEFQTVTLTGSIFGTPAYIPPEQVKGISQTDPRSDQYSLGVMTFELLTGRLPFQGDDPLALVMQHLQEPPPLLTDLRPDLSPEAGRVVARMLAKQPEDRYPDLKSCLRALEASL